MYYSVPSGKNPGIYTTWNDCKKNVIGYSGAIYKKFASKEDAVSYFMSGGIMPKTDVSDDDNKYDIVAYTDGSYNQNTKVYGSGILIRENGKNYPLYFRGDHPEWASMRQIPGEIDAVMYAVTIAVEKKKKNILICYDYEGVEKWATKLWKANNECTQNYVVFMQNQYKNIDVYFKHIKGHSGNIYNDCADKLARMATGLSNLESIANLGL